MSTWLQFGEIFKGKKNASTFFWVTILRINFAALEIWCLVVRWVFWHFMHSQNLFGFFYYFWSVPATILEPVLRTEAPGTTVGNGTLCPSTSASPAHFQPIHHHHNHSFSHFTRLLCHPLSFNYFLIYVRVLKQFLVGKIAKHELLSVYISAMWWLWIPHILLPHNILTTFFVTEFQI